MLVNGVILHVFWLPTEAVELADEGLLERHFRQNSYPIPVDELKQTVLEVITEHNSLLPVDDRAAWAMSQNLPAVLGLRFVQQTASHI